MLFIACFYGKIVFFNKQLLKKNRFFHNFHRLLFMHRHICGFCVISLKCSINYFQYSIKWFLEYCYLKKIIAVRLLTNFTFVLWRISKWKFKVSFPMHAESEHIFLEEAVQCLENFFFLKYSEKNLQEDKCSSSKSKQYFRNKMSMMELVLFSVMLRVLSTLSAFSSISWLLLLCK